MGQAKGKTSTSSKNLLVSFDPLCRRYRYDGLYVVKKVSTQPGVVFEWKITDTMQCWQEKGLNKGGHLVCKYAFVVSRLALHSSVLVALTFALLAFTGSTTYPC